MRRSNSGWLIVLEGGGGTWEITEITSTPYVGDKVRIRKGAVGGYLGSVGLNNGTRFRRIT